MSLRARNVPGSTNPTYNSSHSHTKQAPHSGYQDDLNDLEGGGGGGGMLHRNVSNSSMSSSITTAVAARDAMDHSKYHHTTSFYTSQYLNLFSTPQKQESAKQLALMMIAVCFLFALILYKYSLFHWSILCLVYASCAFGVVVSLYLSRLVLSMDDGTAEMRAVSDPIKDGAAGFLNVQYSAIAKFALPIMVLIVFSYQFRPSDMEGGGGGASKLGNVVLGLVAALGFAFGAICSAISGYLAMWVAARSNIRVASAARRSYGEALVACFNGGAFSAVLNLTLCILGVTVFYTILYFFFAHEDAGSGYLDPSELPMLSVGYGFGASFVALFMQLGGGIYTKAADVGADLVGKVERSIPEDDPRNPAVIADLVGDMVGDCVGSSADVFESVAAEIIGAMILGSTLTKEARVESTGFILFPLMVHAMDIFVSTIGIYCVSKFSGGNHINSSITNPMDALEQGYRVAMGLSIIGFFILTRWLLNPVPLLGDVEDMSFFGACSTKFFFCGLVGMACAYIIVRSTQYYTDYQYAPVQSIAEASTTGHGTNIIVGVSVGMKATLIPTVTVSIAVLTAYHLGSSTGIGSGHNAGLFGTAVATMGMLSNAVYILSMNNYGPIADNAGGIAEMSMQPEHVRDATDKLDAAGNVTKAITKGYSIGSASMACFLLFGAFMDEFSQFSGLPFESVNLACPEVLIGGLLGSMIIFYFTGLAIAAVGRTAHEVSLDCFSYIEC